MCYWQSLSIQVCLAFWQCDMASSSTKLTFENNTLDLHVYIGHILSCYWPCVAHCLDSFQCHLNLSSLTFVQYSFTFKFTNMNLCSHVFIEPAAHAEFPETITDSSLEAIPFPWSSIPCLYFSWSFPMPLLNSFFSSHEILHQWAHLIQKSNLSNTH